MALTSGAWCIAWRTRLSESGGWVALIQKVTVRVAGAHDARGAAVGDV